MANYIAQCITPRVSSDHISKVTVPSGGLKAGQVVIVNTLDNTINGNIEVFLATKPTTALLGSEAVAMVVNDGFETLADGRRPAGQPNYFQYEFKEGEVAPVVFLDRHLMFNIGADALDPSTASDAAVGKFLYITNDSNYLTVGSSIPAGTATGLKIVATYNTPVGGNFGGGFATSFIAIAQ